MVLLQKGLVVCGGIIAEDRGGKLWRIEFRALDALFRQGSLMRGKGATEGYGVITCVDMIIHPRPSGL